MVFNVTILGSNSAIPTLKRNPTAQLMNHNERLFLIDCGEGTQMQLRRNRVRIQRINHIFISHLHGDHFFGLIGLISSMHLLGRNKELHIYGPEKLKEILDLQLDASQTELIYPLIFHKVDTDQHEVVYEDEKLIVSTIPLNHRIPTCGYLFREKQGKRKLVKEKLRGLDLQSEDFLKLKVGEDYIDKNGKRYKNEELTLPPPIPRSYAYCSDTSFYESIVPIIKGVDLLYHEATFKHDKAEVAAEKFHSTTIEAGTIARNAEAGKLLIGHFSNRYEDLEELLDETKQVFPNSEVAIEGKTFDV